MARYCEPSGNVQLFKGSVTVTREYEEGHREARIDIETGTCITNPNPSQTHENALEGASDVKQVSSTRTQPNRVQRANASGNNLPTKFEAARSRFLLGATAFRTREMQKCLLLSSKSAKLSFSQEKLLTTHYHEPTHISHQWTCESVSGSHLRERSDAGRTQHTRLIQTS